jgi:predicted DCC family thiol-disulfide oxidoreductase YuxK
MSETVTVYYDSGCPLCLKEIGLMRRLDKRGRIDFVDVFDERSTCPLDRDTLLARFHALDERGELVSGAAAFAAMWRQIPWLRPLGLLARYRPVLWVLERLYRLFLKVRPGLQRLAGGAPGGGGG